MNNGSSFDDQRLRFAQLRISDDDSESEDSEQEEEQNLDLNQGVDADLVDLRRRIYMAIMASVDLNQAEERLLQLELQPGQEMELCEILIECCSKERDYIRYYGLLGERLCMINELYGENFEMCFTKQYSSVIQQLKSKQLGSVAKFFAHLLAKDALPWHVLSCVHLTEEDTTLSSLKFIKILFLELTEHLGMGGLMEHLNDPAMQEIVDSSILPIDTPENRSFAIHFFTYIGLGFITQG